MIHHERVTIYWRPKKTSSRQWLYDESKINKEKVEELLTKIDELLPDLEVRKNFSYQTHVQENGKVCDYDPYAHVYAAGLKEANRLQAIEDGEAFDEESDDEEAKKDEL